MDVSLLQEKSTFPVLTMRMSPHLEPFFLIYDCILHKCCAISNQYHFTNPISTFLPKFQGGSGPPVSPSGSAHALENILYEIYSMMVTRWTTYEVLPKRTKLRFTHASNPFFGLELTKIQYSHPVVYCSPYVKPYYNEYAFTGSQRKQFFVLEQNTEKLCFSQF